MLDHEEKVVTTVSSLLKIVGASDNSNLSILLSIIVESDDSSSNKLISICILSGPMYSIKTLFHVLMCLCRTINQVNSSICRHIISTNRTKVDEHNDIS